MVTVGDRTMVHPIPPDQFSPPLGAIASLTYGANGGVFAVRGWMARRLKRTTITMGRPLLLASVVTLAAAVFASAQEWTRFRGPNGSGLSPAPVPAAWSEEDVRWKVRLAGVGHASPVFWGEKIFLTSGNPMAGKRIVQCLDKANGWA
jgi:hypothetical protein